VQVQVAPNPGAARSGSLVIAGRTVAVSQEGGCTFALDTEVVQVGRNGGTRVVQVTTDGSCGWTAVSNVPWMRITRGASSQGSGQVEFEIDRNDDDARTGTLTVAGRTVTVTQPGDGNNNNSAYDDSD
jgi:hypothetical protein